eukprot:SAG31_NODE_8875_length_1369_cov_1.236220_1_plen_400_part_01
MRAVCLALFSAVVAAVPQTLTREFPMDSTADSAFVNAVGLWAWGPGAQISGALASSRSPCIFATTDMPTDHPDSPDRSEHPACPDAETYASLTEGQDGLTVVGHAILTEWGLHLDGLGDAAYLETGDYGADASFSYSFWYSKSACQEEGTTSTGVWMWEYLVAHTAGGDSGAYMTGRGSAGGDDNMHIYMGCSQADQGGWWTFQPYGSATATELVSFIRMIYMDSDGHYTLTDMPLGDTESITDTDWTLLAFAMSPTGWSFSLDGVTQDDSVYGQAGHNQANGLDYVSNGNTIAPPGFPSAATEPFSGWEGFGDIPMALGARQCGEACFDREWLGWMSSFSVYGETLSARCSAVIFSNIEMPTDHPDSPERPGPPPCTSFSSCGDLADAFGGAWGNPASQ